MAFGLYTLKIIQPSVTSCLRDGQSIAEEPAYYIISLSMYLSLSLALSSPKDLAKRSWFSRAGVGPEILHSDKFR